MSVKAMAAVVAAGEGHELNVSAFCAEAGVHRKTFYKWVARYREEGLAGLQERSRRPLQSPTRTAIEVEEAIVRLRKELPERGAENGADTIQYYLAQDETLGGQVPSTATIHRILRRRGLVVPAPQKRPKSSWRRFKASAPNELWQIDATEWHTAAGPVQIFNVLDDHSRVLLAARAVPEASTAQAWKTFCAAAAEWGPPSGVLSDNGLCFSGKLRRFEVAFEHNLREAGVRPITGRPHHPQTTGKVERSQQTEKRWLRSQPLAADLHELQTQLDAYRDYYNHQRPHQGIGRRTPISRWQAGVRVGPADSPLEHPDYSTRRITTRVSTDGKVTAGRFIIQIGARWRHQPALVLIDTHAASIFINNILVHYRHLDPARRYQPAHPASA